MGRPSLPEALHSVLSQSWPAVRVKLVLASGQPLAGLGDALADVLADPRIELINPGQPLSRAAAANRVLAAADTELALFLDDDDWLLPDHLARLVQALQANPQSHPPAVAAHAGVECLRTSLGLTHSVHVFDEDITAAGMQLNNRLPIHATLFRIAAVRQSPALRFNESLDYFEDWDFWLQLMARGSFIRVPGVSAIYRLDDQVGSGHSVSDSQLRARMLEKFGQLQLARWTSADVAALIEHESAQTQLVRRLRQDSDVYQARHGHPRERIDKLQAELRVRARQVIDLQDQAAQLERQQIDLRIELTAQHRSLQTQLAEQAERAEQEAAQLRVQSAELTAQRDSERTARLMLERHHLDVMASLSWRITAPLRVLRSWATAGQARVAARRLVRALPLSAEQKSRIGLKLAGSRAGGKSLRWLTAPPPTPSSRATTSGEAPATKPPVLDKEAVRAAAEQDLTLFLDSAQRLKLSSGQGERPDVSVIVVLYNQAGLSLLCLQALAASRSVSFETIIVDNASSDRMPQLLERIDGARILRQDSNLGFLRAVNLAAEHATGEHLLLLNNDAVVEPETLAHAVSRLALEPSAGAVGGPILLWDGRLQEAGSIIWRDGSCQGYGRGESPADPAYRFVRDVDYCSGAFLMLRRALFEQLGRFDEAFAPAYYEESDFCVRLWEAGHRVVCDPKVRVKHFEFASDTGGGGGGGVGSGSGSQAMFLQARNRARFVAKHARYLSGRPEAGVDRSFVARQIIPPGALRILIIDDRVPLPDLGRGYPRAAMMAAIIGQGQHALTYYPLQIADCAWDDVYAVLNERTEVVLDQGLAGLPHFLAHRAGQFDLILVSRPHNMAPVASLRASRPAWFKGARMVYDAEALFSLRAIERAKVLGRPMPEAKAKALLDEELALALGADRIVAVSADEAGEYRKAGCSDVVMLGHALKLQPSAQAFERRTGFLFVGAITQDDCPNGDSVRWFIAEVWPLILAELGADAQLDVVGVCESEAVRGLASEAIRIHGRVAELAPFFEARRVFIVPTRFAAGVPHKAHEAASRGLPMVVTPLIARQLGWREEVLVGDGALAFAQACLHLHANAHAWATLRAAALASVERDCSRLAFEQAVQDILR